MKKIEKRVEGTNFTAINVGALNQLGEHGFTHPKSGQEIKGKIFLKDATNATGTQISYSMLPPKTELPFFHTHKTNEETYLILSGAGKFQVDDQCFDIAEGSVVRVAPEGKRGMTNMSEEPMIYVVIQSKEGSLEEHTSDDGTMMQIEPLWRSA